MSTATVAAEKVVFLHYTLRDDAGEIIDSSEGTDPLLYLHGAGNIVPGLEKALEGQAIGAKLDVKVTPEEGYGVRDPKATQQVPRAAFGELELKQGMQLVGEDEGGNAFPFWIGTFDDETVQVDLNHPLAGKTLNFAVTVDNVRDATAEELAHNHPHGPTGHEGHTHH